MTPEIKVTEQEKLILKDTEFLLLKQKVIQKLWNRLETLENSIKKVALENVDLFPDEINYTGKVSRGENYKFLPYLVLDCPRLLKPDNILTFRTMIWWGNEISCTFHIQGEALTKFRDQISKKISILANKDFFICVNNTTPWQYHFEKNNYLKIKEINKDKLCNILTTSPFIKVSRKIDINEIDQLEFFTLETFTTYLKILSP